MRNAALGSLVLSLMVVCLFSTGCVTSWTTPDHIVHCENFNDMIIGGNAFTRGEIPLGTCRRIAVPSEGVEVMVGGPSDRVLVCVDKCLAEVSHPPEILDIADMQHGMGCCYRVLEDRIEIADFGVILQSGNGVDLALVVPPGVEVIADGSLGATYSESEGFSPVMNPEGDWLRLQEIPDPQGAEAFRDDEWPRDWFVPDQ